MYRALGLADLGASLSCQRDYALVQGFNSEIELTRTQTIMEGAPFCDFRFRLGEASSSRVEPETHDQPNSTAQGRNEESAIVDSGP
jgi:hypothetical protein